jgi:hypothetical protein
MKRASAQKAAAIISIQLPRNGDNKDAFLRAVSDSAAVEDLRKLVTQMCRKPADFDLSGKRYAQSPAHRIKRAAPVIREDDDVAELVA